MSNLKSKKVAVAMSGGLDSSITAYLLQKEGYEVVGITGKMQDDANFDKVIQNAKDVCDSLGIEHISLNLNKKFKSCVIDYFENSYISGLTPNPCIACNRTIKWGEIFDYAINTLGCDYYATGHYAQIVENNGKFKLKRAKDDNKDQIYYLYKLTQDDLKHTLFPLAEYVKPEIRKIAVDNDLPCKSSKESQDICFISPPDTAKKYLLRTFEAKKGDFVDINSGQKAGEHDGFFLYTIGQRKGIGIAAPKPLYVISIDAKTNTVYVGYKENLYKDCLNIDNVNWQQPEYAKQDFKALVKIRYNTTAKPCTIKPEGNTAHIIFDESQSGVTPGQAAVIYDENNEYLIGGGTII